MSTMTVLAMLSALMIIGVILLSVRVANDRRIEGLERKLDRLRGSIDRLERRFDRAPR
jgi:hypothetical protein